jgi:hypothetical protein
MHAGRDPAAGRQPVPGDLDGCGELADDERNHRADAEGLLHYGIEVVVGAGVRFVLQALEGVRVAGQPLESPRQCGRGRLVAGHQ